jgi:hypothetical protein
MVQDTGEQQPGRATVWPGRLGVTQPEGSAAAAGATVSPSLVSTSKECLATKLSFQGAKMGFREIQVDVRTNDSDVMAGAGGAAGPAPGV